MNTKKGKIILPATDPSSIDLNKLKPGQVVLFGDSTKEGSISMKRKDGRVNDLTELGSADGTGSVPYPEYGTLALAVKKIEGFFVTDVVPPSTGHVLNIAPFVIINKQLECNTSLYDRWNGYDVDAYTDEVIDAGLQSTWIKDLQLLLSDINEGKAILADTETRMKELKSECEQSTGSDLSVLLSELESSIAATELSTKYLSAIEQKLNVIISILNASEA